MLAGSFKHIYRGRDDTAHCPPYTLASWDCQQRIEALCQEGIQGAVQSGHKNASSTDTDREMRDESKEGADRQTSSGDKAETNTHTN